MTDFDPVEVEERRTDAGTRDLIPLGPHIDDLADDAYDRMVQEEE